MTCNRKILERIAFLLVCLAALVACKKKEGGKCSTNSNCAKGLYCVDADHSAGKCMTEAQATAACRASKDCASNGKCSFSRWTGNCQAASAADCLQSSACKTLGYCEASGSGYCAKPASTTNDKESSAASSPDKTSTGSSTGTSTSSCPTGYTRRGDKCVKYSCPSGCTYIGDGKCRCRR